MAVGLTSVLTSVTEILLEWASSGDVMQKHKQGPAHLFVDCSNGVDRRTGLLAEQSFDDFTRRLDRLPVILMVLRLLDWGARYNPSLRRTGVKTIPYATEWIMLLGGILFSRHAESKPILNGLHEKALALADKLRDDNPEVASLLEDDRCNPNPAWRLAEGLSLLMSKSSLWTNLYGGLDGFLNVNRPNGLAAKRRIQQSGTVIGKRTKEVRSIVFTDSVLDYLVHLHVLRSGNRPGFRPLSFKGFVQLLRDRYGFCVNVAPLGMTISNDLLRTNHNILERRLRDLGLLVGVNDAEAMKHLRPRFERPAEDENVLD